MDTNILLPAVDSANAAHTEVAAFLNSPNDRDDVTISEFVLIELYGLLRNPPFSTSRSMHPLRSMYAKPFASIRAGR